jgi:tetratricopeptide (TPR) repeat protein
MSELFSSSAVEDHPLIPSSSGSGMDLELSGRGQQGASNPSSSSAATPSPAFYAAAPPPPLPQNRLPSTFAPPPLAGHASQASPLLPPPPTYASSLNLSQPAPASLEDLADAFLSAPSTLSAGEADESPGTGRLRPEPLDDRPVGGSGGTGDVERLKVIASRRAWADVVAMAQQLIKPGGTSHYATLYGDLLLRYSTSKQASISSDSSPPPSAVLALESQQEELVDILILLVKGLLFLRRYPELKQLLDQWGFLFHNVVKRQTSLSKTVEPSPSWIPWKLHVLAATALLDVPTVTPQASSGSASAPSSLTASSPIDAVDVLWMIRDAIPSTDLRSTMFVEQALSNVLIRTKRWRMAIACLQRVMDLLPAAIQENENDRLQQRYSSSSPSSSDEAIQILESSYRVELLSCQGRIMLQLGALPEADQIFQEARSSWDEVSAMAAQLHSSASLEVVRRAPIQLAANQALLCFASNQYAQALELFQHVVTLIRRAKSQPTTLTPGSSRGSSLETSDALVGVPSMSGLYSQTCNNMALCAIYTCRLHEAIHLMESVVRQDPTRYLTDRVALNLW